MTAAEAVISKYTKRVAGAGAVILVLYSAAAALAPGEFGHVFLSDWGGAILGFAAAGFILRTALCFERGESLRTQWLLICAAVTLWAFGDGMFALVVSSTHASPAVPGPQDVFYVAGYVLVPIALLMIAYSYRRLVDMRWPAFVAGGITAAFAGLMWLAVIQPSLDTTTTEFAERVTLAFYPLAALVLALGPVILIILTITRLGAGRLAWPWWLAAVGAGSVAISSAVYSYLTFNSAYTSGSLVDYGWALGYYLILCGALVERDVQSARRTS
jgi:hypothetical protein